jgi:hypothetical protein
MPDALVLDTNVLPVWRGLDGPLWLSVRKMCELAQIDLVIPEVVVYESLNLRSGTYAQAATRFVDAFGEIEKFFDIEPIYVPDESEIRDSWEAELRGVFTVVPIDGADAVEALRREATRTRPARDGRGSRDSAVWLTVTRLAADGRDVLFVSNNTKDFGVRKTNDLHPELAAEAASLSGSVRYFTSIYAVVDELATKVEPPAVAPDDLGPVLGFDFRQLALASAAEDERHPEISATELISEHLRVTDLEVKNAYTVGDRNLVLVMGRASLPVGDPSDGHELAFSFSAWLDFNPEDGAVVAGEVQNFALAEPT